MHTSGINALCRSGLTWQHAGTKTIWEPEQPEGGRLNLSAMQQGLHWNCPVTDQAKTSAFEQHQQDSRFYSHNLTTLKTISCSLRRIPTNKCCVSASECKTWQRNLSHQHQIRPVQHSYNVISPALCSAYAAVQSICIWHAQSLHVYVISISYFLPKEM